MIDLHLHTNRSDGRDTPAALADRCGRAGLRVFAVTDHDTIAAWPEAGAAAAAAGLAFVPGVEITAVHGGRDVHVLGYFSTPRAPLLAEFLDDQLADRRRRARLIVERLREIGKPVDRDAALQRALGDGERAVGRPQIADALVAAGHVASRDEAFERYLGHGAAAFVPRSGAPPEEVAQLILAAGGLPSLAHPGPLGLDAAIPSMVAAGLGAIEAFHPDHDLSGTGRYEELAARSDLLVTGGSDFHGGDEDPGMLGRVVLPAAHYERVRERLRRA